MLGLKSIMNLLKYGITIATGPSPASLHKLAQIWYHISVTSPPDSRSDAGDGPVAIVIPYLSKFMIDFNPSMSVKEILESVTTEMGGEEYQVLLGPSKGKPGFQRIACCRAGARCDVLDIILVTANSPTLNLSITLDSVGTPTPTMSRHEQFRIIKQPVVLVPLDPQEDTHSFSSTNVIATLLKQSKELEEKMQLELKCVKDQVFGVVSSMSNVNFLISILTLNTDDA